MASRFCPGPTMLTLLVTASSPLVSKIVPETPEASIVSPSVALASASRNEPGPLSLVVVTVRVAAWRPDAAEQNRPRAQANSRRFVGGVNLCAKDARPRMVHLLAI